MVTCWLTAAVLSMRSFVALLPVPPHPHNINQQNKQRYLRDMLQEIARMHTSGPHRNCWELKPEFKTSGEVAGDGAERGDAKEPQEDA